MVEVGERVRASWRRWGVSFLAYLAFCSGAFLVVLVTCYVLGWPRDGSPIPWPTLDALDRVFKDRSLNYADVLWHVWLVHGDYEPLPAADPYGQQHNWAYFPLTVYLGKFAKLVVGDPWWSLQLVTLLSVAGLLTVVREETKRRSLDWTFAHEAVLAFFVLPIGWPCINFIALAMLVELALFFWLLRIARADVVGAKSVLVTGALAIAVGFSRPQGLVVDALLAVSIVLLLRRKGSLTLAAVLLLPLPLVLAFYGLKVGDPLAFYHVQRAWGRSLSAPWVPWVEAARAGWLSNAFHDLIFNAVRMLLTVAGIGYAAWRLRAEPSDPADRRERRLEGAILAVTFVLWLLPSMTGILLGMHRLYCFAMYPFVAPTRRNPVTKIGSRSLLLLCFVRVVEIVLLFDNRLVAIW